MRLFGRSSRPVGDGPDPWLDDPVPAGPPPPRHAPGPSARPAPVGSGGPATAAARPALWTPRRPPQDQPAEPEPVTDPFGFPPVPAAAAAADDDVSGWAPAGGAPATTENGPATPTPSAASPYDPWSPPSLPDPPRTPAAPARSPASRPGGVTTRPETDDAAPSSGPPVAVTSGTSGAPPKTDRPGATGRGSAPGTADEPAPSIDAAEAGALAGAFAVDLLSWDENDPARRGRALGAYLASSDGNALLGWTGTGRQRADLVLPGRVRPDGDRVHVDVRVRVVPYRRVDRSTGAPEPEAEVPLGEPAAAPAPSARGWRGLAARWVRLEITVVRDGEGLVVDAGPLAQPHPSPAELAGRSR